MDYKTVETFNMTARQWHQLANFAQRVGWTLLFDLNVLDRHNGSWTGKNAELLFDYASRKSVGPVYWQLGNEPNILPHFYNRSINPSTLGRDFLKLSTIVKKYKAFQQSLIVGPDVTHPKQDMNSSKPMKYLRAFLQAGGEALDAVSWHHYYFDGRQATADDFVNITHFDSFKEQAKLVCSETRRILGQKKSVWLTETSDGYGGGVRNLSQTFIANFLWLDKLGVSAQQGIELIVRQSFYHGCYGLLNPNLEPTPVYWLSVLHKRLVGTQVFNVSHNSGSKIRFYSHCGNRKSSLVVFGMNLNNFSVGVNFGKELAKVKFRVFIWTEDLVIKGFKDIQNKFVKDISFEMPPKSIAFVKFRKLVGVQACK
ncbi:heparanase-like isoform X2 [Artemia franciscana]